MTEQEKSTSEVGPFYTLESLADYLGVTDIDLLEEGLLEEPIVFFTSSDGDRLFPVWQFSGDKELYSNILDVFHILLKIDIEKDKEWAAILWMESIFPFDYLTEEDNSWNDVDSLPIYRHLINNEYVDVIKSEAKETVETWSE